MDLRIEGDELIFGQNGLRVGFQRTLRIPDDGRSHPLPAGFGLFPLRRVEDYASRVPPSWRTHGGIFLPMYQREAMWLRFRSPAAAFAVKVGVGKVCALTGLPWLDALRPHPQDYLVAPPQPWLDGIYVGAGVIRQFVAMPLGQGYTVEGQVTGEERHGGLQLAIHEPKLARPVPPRRRRGRFDAFGDLDDEVEMSCDVGAPIESSGSFTAPSACRAPRNIALCTGPITAPGASPVREMGLAAGGRMHQKIHPDPFGFDEWRPLASARVFVHLVNSEAWQRITGECAPLSPITAKSYREAGIPWFRLYDEAAPTLAPRPILAGVEGIAELDARLGEPPDPADAPVDAWPVRRLWPRWLRSRITDGLW